MELFVAITILVLMAAWTLYHVPRDGDLGDGDAEKDKLREFLVLDIRSLNQYCMAILGLLGVLATILVANDKAVAPILEKLEIWPFGVGFLASALSLLFIPTGFGRESFRKLRGVWLRTVLCEQVAVVFTVYGIWKAMAVVTG